MRATKRRKPTSKSKNSKTPVSSIDARKLLWHRYRRTKSWREVTTYFELDNVGQTYRMAIGIKPDTPAMRVVVRRARAMAAMAFYGDKPKSMQNGDDHHRLRTLIRHTRNLLEKLESELLTTEAIGL